jgi:hypothetical protein
MAKQMSEIQIHIENTLLDTLGSEHQGSSRQTNIATYPPEFRNTLGFLSEDGEDSRETPYCKNLILDYLTTSIPFFWRDWHRGCLGFQVYFLFELLSRADIQHRDEHIGNWTSQKHSQD